MSIAVAPAVNLSGSTDFDPERFADLMASELTYVDGIEVIPVSRVLAVLQAQRVRSVQSAAHAWDIREALGADAVLVCAVTEYDPYDPPSIGLEVQLFGLPPQAGDRLDPVAQSRRATFAAEPPPRPAGSPLARVQRTFDAGHAEVVAAVQRFADRRGGDNHPFGWRRVVVSQREFIRFCCHEALTALMSGGNQESEDGIAEQ
ncbi:MAG: hypothetical protein C4547_15085 [Phycisphaerales bacterium]|nr:MAG: hypothetical protein C4547_15085 [Phycisphaerales bacterium]